MERTTGGTGRAVLLLLALLGLFAMHGLGDHGASGHHGGAPPASTSASTSQVHDAHAATSADLADLADLAAATTLAPLVSPAEVPLGTADAAGAGLCLAVLLLGLALLVGSRRGPWLLRRVAPALPARALAPPGRRPDPPDLARLCVLRC